HAYAIQKTGPYEACPDGYLIEGDASAASYFLALPLVTGGSVEIHGVTKGSLQGDLAFAGRMQACGAQISWNERSSICSYQRSAGKPSALNGSFYAYSDTFLTGAALSP